MNTWKDTIQDILAADDVRLSDPAVVEINGELYEIQVLEVECEEIADQRLIAYLKTE